MLLTSCLSSTQPKCWWEVDEAADSPNQQQQQQQQAGAPNSSSSSSHVVRLMANRVSAFGAVQLRGGVTQTARRSNKPEDGSAVSSYTSPRHPRLALF